MLRSRIIITYLMLWTKFALNGTRLMKIEFGGEIFVFGKVGQWVAVMLLTDLSLVEIITSAC